MKFAWQSDTDYLVSKLSNRSKYIRHKIFQAIILSEIKAFTDTFTLYFEYQIKECAPMFIHLSIFTQ